MREGSPATRQLQTLTRMFPVRGVTGIFPRSWSGGGWYLDERDRVAVRIDDLGEADNVALGDRERLVDQAGVGDRNGQVVESVDVERDEGCAGASGSSTTCRRPAPKCHSARIGIGRAVGGWPRNCSYQATAVSMSETAIAARIVLNSMKSPGRSCRMSATRPTMLQFPNSSLVGSCQVRETGRGRPRAVPTTAVEGGAIVTSSMVSPPGASPRPRHATCCRP